MGYDMREIPITQNQMAINTNVRITGGATGKAKVLDALSSELSQRSQSYQAKAQDTAYIKGQSLLINEMQKIETNNKFDPDAMANAFDEYGTAFLEEITDPNVRARYEAQIQTNAQDAVARSTALKQKQIDEENMFQSLQGLDLIQTEIANSATGLLDSDPMIAVSSGKKLQENMMRGQSIINQTGSDGLPLFSASQRSSTLLALRDASYKSATMTWYQAQENKLDAAEKWLNSEVVIQLPDDQGGFVDINLRETMPETSRAKIDNEIMGMMRDNISLQAQRTQIEEKASKDLAERNFIEDQTRSQDSAISGGAEALTLQELDNKKQIYLKGGMKTEYIAMRKNIIEGTPIVVDGVIRNQLFNMAYKGIDPGEFGTASVGNRRVDWETVNQARAIYKSVTGPSTDVSTFYTNNLIRSLGGENQNLDIAAQETISRAVIEMTSQFRELQQAGELNDSKAKEVFNRVIQNNSNLTLEDRVIARTPQFIPKSEVGGRATKETSEKFSKQISERFVLKYNGDIEKALTDPEYLEAKSWLRDYNSQIRTTVNEIK
jgi:hypothetical protein